MMLSWRLLAEERIRTAQADGQFDNLSGFGKPIPGIDDPPDENWWIKAKLKREQLSHLPPALAVRVDCERTLAGLAVLKTESAVRQAILALNERVRKASFATAWGPPVDMLPLDVEQIVQHWRARGQVETTVGCESPAANVLSAAESAG